MTDILDLTQLTAPASGDALYIVDDPSGTPSDKYIDVVDLLNFITDGTIPYVSASGLADSPIETDGSKITVSLVIQDGSGSKDGIEIWSGTAAGGVNLGADVNQVTRSSNTRKVGTIHCPDYANTSQVEIFSFNSPNASNNDVNIGGRSGGSNKGATTLNFLTAADTATNGGTVALSIDASQNVSIPAGTLEVGTPETYSASNVTTDRTFDANGTTVAELADVLGTLIADLRTIGLVD